METERTGKKGDSKVQRAEGGILRPEMNVW